MSDFTPGDKSSRGSTVATGNVATTTHQFTGSLYVTGTINCVIDSGSAAGAGSYVVVDANDRFVLDSTPDGGGGGSPGGSDTQIQYNDDGAFGGVSAFLWNTNISALEISNNIPLHFGTEAGDAASLIKRDQSSDFLIISGTAANGTIISGGIYVDAVNSGSIGGAGSYVGLSANGKLVLTASAGGGGGGGSPGGSDAQIQYNDDGAFGGISAFKWDSNTSNLEISDDTELIFGLHAGSAASFIKRDSGDNYLVISGTVEGTIISGSIFADAINSGSIGGAGSYVGLNANGKLVLTASSGGGGGGGGSPGGSDTQIQYNNGGAFGGVSSLTYNDSTNALSVAMPSDTDGAFEIKEGSNTYITISTAEEFITSTQLHAFAAGIIVEDNIGVYFGSDEGGAASIEYDEDGTSKLIISGAANGFDINIEAGGEGAAFEISQGPNAYITISTAEEMITSAQLHAFSAGAIMEDDVAIYFGHQTEGGNASIEYDADGDGYLVISGSSAGIAMSSSAVYLHSTGDAHLILNADMDNLGEGDNPAIEFRQDGGANKSAIGMIMTGKDPVGGTFTDGLDNAFALTTLIAGVPIQMGVRKLATANAVAQFTIETVSGNIGINNPTPKVPLDVFWNGVEELANDTGGGDIVLFGTASGPSVAGALMYLNSDGGWDSASADVTGSGNSQLLGIAMGTDPTTDGMLVKGYFNATTYFADGFTKGEAIYIQSGTVGSHGYMSGAAPTEADAYVRIVGYATDTANVIYFNPSSDWVELD